MQDYPAIGAYLFWAKFKGARWTRTRFATSRF